MEKSKDELLNDLLDLLKDSDLDLEDTAELFKTKEKKKKREKLVKEEPYILKIQSQCKLCGSKEEYYFLMMPQIINSIEGKVSIPLKIGELPRYSEHKTKVMKEKKSSCHKCSSILIYLEKEELIKKLIEESKHGEPEIN